MLNRSMLRKFLGDCFFYEMLHVCANVNNMSKLPKAQY